MVMLAQKANMCYYAFMSAEHQNPSPNPNSQPGAQPGTEVVLWQPQSPAVVTPPDSEPQRPRYPEYELIVVPPQPDAGQLPGAEGAYGALVPRAESSSHDLVSPADKLLATTAPQQAVARAIQESGRSRGPEAGETGEAGIAPILALIGQAINTLRSEGIGPTSKVTTGPPLLGSTKNGQGVYDWQRVWDFPGGFSVGADKGHKLYYVYNDYGRRDGEPLTSAALMYSPVRSNSQQGSSPMESYISRAKYNKLHGLQPPMDVPVKADKLLQDAWQQYLDAGIRKMRDDAKQGPAPKPEAWPSAVRLAGLPDRHLYNQNPHRRGGKDIIAKRKKRRNR
jgi:hypothetical protein